MPFVYFKKEIPYPNVSRLGFSKASSKVAFLFLYSTIGRWAYNNLLIKLTSNLGKAIRKGNSFGNYWTDFKE